MNIVAIIPARLDSSRLANKPLARINGKTMIEQVYCRVRQSDLFDDVVVATDSEIIANIIINAGGTAVTTTGLFESGTDRIAHIAQSIDARYIINVQGDEPLIENQLLKALKERLETDKHDIVSVMCDLSSEDQARNPNCVKVVCDVNNDTLYFSRSLIPHGNWEYAYRHVGIYGFKREVLLEIAKLEPSKLEKTESLEQLRWLENGYKINMVHTDAHLISVDTKEDLKKAQDYFNK